MYIQVIELYFTPTTSNCVFVVHNFHKTHSTIVLWSFINFLSSEYLVKIMMNVYFVVLVVSVDGEFKCFHLVITI